MANPKPSKHKLASDPMTWGQLKRRVKELGVRDDDLIGIINVDDEGRAKVVVAPFLLHGTTALPMFPARS